MQNEKYDSSSSDLLQIILSLTPEQRSNEFICHAMKVRIAVFENDYHFFLNYKTSVQI